MAFLLVNDRAGLEVVKEEILAEKIIAYDYETYEVDSSYEELTGKKRPIDMLRSKIAGVAYGFSDNQYYVNIGHTDAAGITVEDINELNKLMIGKVVVAHNLKFEIKISRINNVFFPEEDAQDTMIMADEFSSELWKGLKSLGKEIFEYEYEEENLAKKYKMNELSGEQTYAYACSDVLLTRALYIYFMENLDPEVLEHYQLIELPLVRVLASMELAGVNFDLERCQHEFKVCETRMEELLKEIEALTWEGFKPRSSKHLKEYFLEEKKYPVWKTTDKGQPSMDKQVMKYFVREHQDPVAELIIKYKGYSTLISFFFKKLPHLQHKDTGKIHAEFRQANTQTGRLTCKNPNLQQNKKGKYQPEEGDEAAEIVEAVNVRSLFIADSEDERIVSLDFSGIELRVCAILTEDETMVNALQHDLDLHTETAKGVFGEDCVNEEDFNSKYRRIAKTMNFLILYGGKEYRLAMTLNYEYTEEECAAFIENWFATYPGVVVTQKETNLFVEKHKYAETLWGRRRYFEKWNFFYDKDMKDVRKKAFNHQIQGSAGDMMKIVMLKINEQLPEVKMLMQVHDELVFSIPLDGLYETVKKLHAIFTDWDFDVPIYSSVEVGKNYGEMTEFAKPNGDADFDALQKAITNEEV